jgi:hypothetical protein
MTRYTFSQLAQAVSISDAVANSVRRSRTCCLAKLMTLNFQRLEFENVSLLAA